jgi:hypothetical protein
MNEPSAAAPADPGVTVESKISPEAAKRLRALMVLLEATDREEGEADGPAQDGTSPATRIPGETPGTGDSRRP